MNVVALRFASTNASVLTVKTVTGAGCVNTERRTGDVETAVAGRSASMIIDVANARSVMESNSVSTSGLNQLAGTVTVLPFANMIICAVCAESV